MLNFFISNYLKFQSQNFWRCLPQAQATQEKILRQYLRRNADTIFGRQHHFNQIKSSRDYQKSVPLSQYEAYEPAIAQLRAGNQRVLFREPLKLLEPTSGSSGKQKLIPYTRTLQTEFNRGIFPWLADMVCHYPDLFADQMYWSISPALPSADEETIGFSDDSEYLGLVGRLTARLFPVPQLVREISEVETFQSVTNIFLFRATKLKFISIWSPTFLLNLLQNFKQHKLVIIKSIIAGRLLLPGLEPKLKCKLEKYLSPARSKELPRLRQMAQENLSLAQIFPELRLVSCWGDANASPMFAQLKAKLAPIPVQKKGLIATEAFVSLPLLALKRGHLLAYQSHFFEFQDVENKQMQLLGTVKKGRRYRVVVTTGGGLYRYLLGDIITVVDFYAGVPVIEFIGRENVADYCGEKLSEQLVLKLLNDYFKHQHLALDFYFFAPEKMGATYGYYLYLESLTKLPVIKISQDLEKSLQTNYHYHYCRRLGQLAPLRVRQITKGMDKYLYRCQSEFKQKLGDIKISNFSPRLNWRQYYENKN